MRPLAYIALTSAACLAACGGPKTQAELLIGEWEQSEPITMTEQGQTVTLSDTEVEYKADGTTEGTVTMTLSGVPADMATYRITGSSSYVLEDGVVTETLIDGTVESIGGNAQAQQMATMIQSGMGMEPVSSSTIVTLTEDTLVMREDQTGTLMTFTRD